MMTAHGGEVVDGGKVSCGGKKMVHGDATTVVHGAMMIVRAVRVAVRGERTSVHGETTMKARSALVMVHGETMMVRGARMAHGERELDDGGIEEGGERKRHCDGKGCCGATVLSENRSGGRGGSWDEIQHVNLHEERAERLQPQHENGHRYGWGGAASGADEIRGVDGKNEEDGRGRNGENEEDVRNGKGAKNGLGGLNDGGRCGRGDGGDCIEDGSLSVVNAWDH